LEKLVVQRHPLNGNADVINYISQGTKKGEQVDEQSYDKTSVESIHEFAKQLTGKSLREVVYIPTALINDRNRGDLGSLVESFYFQHRPATNHGPDFPEAGLELKTTGVVKKSDGSYRAKERLVLTMINFESIVGEVWEGSSLLGKCRLMLILFYLYRKELPVVDRIFVLDPLLYSLPNEDLEIIKSDWEFIKKKVESGKAHELSEGDTFYLGACRKGSGGEGEALRKQPFSDEGAKARAFSFKPSYMNKLIGERASSVKSLGVGLNLSFQEATAIRFYPFVGMSIEEISVLLDHHKKSLNHKGFHRELALRILAHGKDLPPELTKAGIEMKTVRIQQNGRPREAMSFPGFKFLDIVNEEWEKSSFFERLERKFLFVVFQTGPDGIERLLKVAYWNMPYEDRLEAMRVWEETKRRVALDATDLPKSSESLVAHVRPKGRNGNDVIPTPQGGMHLRQCFWLNAGYLEQVIGGTGKQIIGNSSSRT
jgi:DNA mismatch repair protein MutH